jgi:hypothetical protein
MSTMCPLSVPVRRRALRAADGLRMAMLEVTFVDAWFAVAAIVAFVAVAAIVAFLVGASARRHAQGAVEADGLPVEDLVLDDVNGQSGELGRVA